MSEYFRHEEIAASNPNVIAEWDEWLRDNFDLGHYDSYKVREQEIFQYVDGKPQWVTDTFMPDHIVAKLKRWVVGQLTHYQTMTTRRAFLAAAFGSATARALPSGVSLFAVATNITESGDVLTYDMILRGLDMLIAHRQPQARMRWYPRSSGGSQTEILSLGLPDGTRS